MDIATIFAVGSELEEHINSFTIRTVGIATLLLIVLMVLARLVVNNKQREHFKKPLFILIALTIGLPSLLMTGSTIYVNTISDSGGPVHWHTDIEFWVCGQEVELRDPVGALSNKIGTSTYHEHDDKRIHLEGVVIDTEVDASLRKFLHVTGGEISTDKLVIPTEQSVFEDDVDGDRVSGAPDSVMQFLTTDQNNRSILSMQNGLGCSPQNRAEIQVFLIRFDEASKTYTQTKLADPGAYVMRDESVVPPGDCVIVEYDVPKNRTTKLCQQYGVRDATRCVEFGVSTYNPELCNIREATETTGGTE